MCKPIPTGLYTRYEFDADLQRFRPNLEVRNYGHVVLSTLFNLLSMIVVKETRIPTPVLLQKLRSFLQTARVVINLWIAVAIQLQSIRKMNWQMQRSTINFSRNSAFLTMYVLYEVELAKSEIEHEELTILGLFILQFANLRLLEL